MDRDPLIATSIVADCPNLGTEHFVSNLKSFEIMPETGFERVVCAELLDGFKAQIAIHSTVNGPALGGTRLRGAPDVLAEMSAGGHIQGRMKELAISTHAKLVETDFSNTSRVQESCKILGQVPELMDCLWNYCRSDGLGLARTMTLKTAGISCLIDNGVRFGGEKSFILSPCAVELLTPDERAKLWESFGQICFHAQVECLDGSFKVRGYASEDMGSTCSDILLAARACGSPDFAATPFIGYPHEYGGAGDPSELTARLNFVASRATATFLFGGDSLNDRSVTVKGLGKVGSALAIDYLGDGVKTLNVLEQDSGRLSTFLSRARSAGADLKRIKILKPGEEFTTQADVVSLCAGSWDLNSRTIALAANAGIKAFCGSANNQLSPRDQGGRTPAQLIEYARTQGLTVVYDPLVSAGGVLKVSLERTPKHLWAQKLEHDWPQAIKAAVTRVLETAKSSDTNSYEIWTRTVEGYLEQLRSESH